MDAMVAAASEAEATVTATEFEDGRQVDEVLRSFRVGLLCTIGSQLQDLSSSSGFTMTAILDH